MWEDWEETYLSCLQSLIDVWCLIKVELITWPRDYELVSFSCRLEACLNINTEKRALSEQFRQSRNFSRLVPYCLLASSLAWTFRLYGFVGGKTTPKRGDAWLSPLKAQLKAIKGRTAKLCCLVQSKISKRRVTENEVGATKHQKKWVTKYNIRLKKNLVRALFAAISKVKLNDKLTIVLMELMFTWYHNVGKKKSHQHECDMLGNCRALA